MADWPVMIMANLPIIGSNSSLQAAYSPVLRGITYGANLDEPNAIPGIPDLLNALLGDYLTREDFDKFMLRHGAPVGSGDRSGGLPPWANRTRLAWDSILRSHETKPPVTILWELRNRDLLTDSEVKRWLHAQGFTREELRNKLLELRRPIPSYQEIVHFAVKEAWDQTTVNLFGYDLEFPRELGYWMKKLGLDYDSRAPAVGPGALQPVNWAQAVWRAHWQPISPTQAYEMFHRLRPGRVARYQVGAVVPEPFNEAQMFQLLKVVDYPQPFRARLAAINYLLPERRVVRQMFNADTIDRREAKEQLRDRGYTEVDAENQTRWMEREKRVKRAHRHILLTKQQVRDSYELGVTTRTQAGRMLFRLSLEDPQDQAAFAAKPLGQQDALADRDPLTQAALGAIDFDVQIRLTKQLIASSRSAVIGGKWDDAFARGRLRSLGLAEGRIDQYLLSWRWERDTKFRELTTAKIQKLLVRGVLSEPVARQRLRRLNWTPQDIAFILAETMEDLQQRVARAQTAAARTQEQRRRGLIAQAKAAALAQKEALAQLVKGTSPGAMKRHYVKGIIGRPLLASRGRILIPDPANLAAYLAEADRERAEYLRKAAQRAAKRSP